MIVRGPARTALVLALAVSACDGIPDGTASPSGRPSPPPSAAAELAIYAAASLKGAVERAAAAFELANPGTTVVVSTDSSSALATQIEHGAPADVFLSADVTNPQRLVGAGLAQSAVHFATNELALVVPQDNPGAVTTARDLARPRVRIVAAGDEVPITVYADQLVANLAATDGYPTDFAAAYAANVVSREDNVRAVVAKIELGEGDAAIVYATDARASSKLATIDLPERANVRAAHAGLVLSSSPQRRLAEQFLAWFVGPEGQSILADLGFLPPA